ncbi:unnamed protein product [Nesidiocoris tenuis]|uniref:Uncharacterized protein n=1 Tax=Nesidiocoris tenuis TaxID=355587 RepID=A0A6H5HD41_9HEMI|nr:unnamed protein product [Nesidiocoris tenuis]
MTIEKIELIFTIHQISNRRSKLAEPLLTIYVQFWRYPMANPRPMQSVSEPSTQQVSEATTTGLNSSLPSSQASSLSSFGSENCKSTSSPPPSFGLLPAKTPPPPPPRWSKPAPNFTVTTTVTFSMTETTTSSSPPPIQLEPSSSSKHGSICDSESLPSIASGTATLESNRGVSVKSPMSEPALGGGILSPVGSDTRSAVLSPVSDSKPPHRRSKRHKESRHYQESDILESPDVYYRSSVADKVSDYEDIWGPESLTTFKPRSSPFTSPEEMAAVSRRVPDILDRIAAPCPAPRTSLVSPQGTQARGYPSPHTPSQPQTPTEQAPANNKQSSPFYCEPADAIKSALEVTRRRNRTTHRNNRHSDPATLTQWPSIAPPGVLERIDSKAMKKSLNRSMKILEVQRNRSALTGSSHRWSSRRASRPQLPGESPFKSLLLRDHFLRTLGQLKVGNLTGERGRLAARRRTGQHGPNQEFPRKTRPIPLKFPKDQASFSCSRREAAVEGAIRNAAVRDLDPRPVPVYRQPAGSSSDSRHNKSDRSFYPTRIFSPSKRKIFSILIVYPNPKKSGRRFSKRFIVVQFAISSDSRFLSPVFLPAHSEDLIPSPIPVPCMANPCRWLSSNGCQGDGVRRCTCSSAACKMAEGNYEENRQARFFASFRRNRVRY